MPLATVVKQVKKFAIYDIFTENPYANTGREGWQNWTRVMYVKGTATFMDGTRLPIRTIYKALEDFFTQQKNVPVIVNVPV